MFFKQYLTDAYKDRFDISLNFIFYNRLHFKTKYVIGKE